MYGNNAKAFLLRAIVNWAGDGQQVAMGKTSKGFVLNTVGRFYRQYFFPKYSWKQKKWISKHHQKTMLLNRTYTYLLMDGYIEERKQIEQEKMYTYVGATPKGVSAVANKYFQAENGKAKASILRDTVTVIVAAATIAALLNPDKATNILQEQQEQLRQQVHELQLKQSLQQQKIEMELQFLKNHLVDTSLHEVKNLHAK